MATLHTPLDVHTLDLALDGSADPGLGTEAAEPHRSLDVRPCGARIDKRLLVGCLQACLEAAARCARVVDACETDAARDAVMRCRELAVAAAEACRVTARIVARLTELDRRITRGALEACAAASRAAGDECARLGA